MRMQRIAENFYVSLPLAVVLVFLPLLNWLSLSWAVFTTLRQNIYMGMASIGVVGFAFFYAASGWQFNNTLQEWLSLCVFIGPLWAMAYSLRLWKSLRLSLELGFFSLALLALLNYGVYGPLNYDELYQTFLNRLFGGELSADSMMQSIQVFYIETMASAAMYAWPALLFMVQVLLLVCGRYIQSRWYYPGGFKTEFHNLRLSQFMAAPLVLSFLWAILAPNQVALQLAGLAALVYSVAGLAWLHWYLQMKNFGKMWLFLLYVVLFMFSAWALPFLAIIALLDSHLDLRKRLNKG